MMRRALTVTAIALLGMGCATTGGKTTRKSIASRPPDYRIGNEDVVEVVVWKEPDLSRVVPVRPDGKIGLPIIGDVDAAGKTTNELRDVLSQRLEPLIKNASVAV